MKLYCLIALIASCSRKLISMQRLILVLGVCTASNYIDGAHLRLLVLDDHLQ